MDFNFSDDQLQLREAVRKWVEKAYSFERRKGIVASGGFDRAVWQELAELGLMGLTVPEAQGGMGLGAIEAMVVLEELGQGLVLEPYAQALLAGDVLAQHADAALQQAWLAPLTSGEALIVLASQERGARYQLEPVGTQAEQSAGTYHISGQKSLVPAGDLADAWIVPALLQGETALFLVEKGATGVQADGYLTQDGSRAAEMRFAKTPAKLITTNGSAALQQAAYIGIASVCASGVGVMDKTLLLTADYLNQRKQFGVVIANFQALRHRMADMKMQLELGRSMSYYAWLKLDEPEAVERKLALSRAKYQLGQSMRFVGQQAVQLHGGIGVTDEYIGSHYFKTLTQLEISWGDSLHHLGIISDNMQETAGVAA
ncbi:acyl-CoA dehydrogenase family protein [Lampropedia aestuarii]|uniref:acyl-CoA dehydrogenase family protein n=1 Tax=Lampropedia aestuarii TaxID=2562762 RepID=UPI002468E5D9|nr:acyl-CoA dehydrogenase family protein [Lampropedia aestuarii]MDH5857127.1 acyl-CoA dehydrogenase family protein [Lampropedia aestuarii]